MSKQIFISKYTCGSPGACERERERESVYVFLSVCLSVCKNVSPEKELFSKGQVRGRLGSKTDFVSLCQLLSAMRALQKQLLFLKPDISEPHTASVLDSFRATALPSLPRGRNTCRRYCLIGIKTKVEN